MYRQSCTPIHVYESLVFTNVLSSESPLQDTNLNLQTPSDHDMNWPFEVIQVKNVTVILPMYAFLLVSNSNLSTVCLS